ncbi:MAG: hypothetical protein FRX49_07684 [Trebouxia sp. A1-2]|nr:MAG: hypothetical protein FRX49_07684 [Trebouxia sp. A1-2]
MWDVPRASTRSCGTYRWHFSLTDAKWWSSAEACIGQVLLSPRFPLCGYLWRLKIFPRGQKTSPDSVGAYLCCIGVQPEAEVAFQLWVHNQTDVQMSASYECSKVFNTGWGNKNFLSSQSLFDTEQGFMQGQEMIVGVHISAIEPAIKRRKRMQDTAPQFGPFFDDPSTSDIVVMAGEAKIHAHKIILSAQSTFFKGMFQVDKLGWLCMQQMIAAMSKKTVLEVIKVADAVTDTELMDICMKFLLESENSYEIAEQPAMQELMLNNPSLAQKLLVGIMKHAAPKKASLETA